MKFLLLLFSFSLFAQGPAEILAVYKQPYAKRISIEQVLIHIRELKAKSSIDYGEAVDFYFKKIVSTGKNQWIEKLEEFSLDPDCHAKNKIKINEQINRIRTLQTGEIAPEIQVGEFRLSHYSSKKSAVLVLFYSPSCFHCTELLIDLIPYTEKANLAVIALQIDKEMNPWTFPIHWKTMKADEKVLKAYGVISTPSLFLIQAESKRVIGLPESLNQLKELEKLF